jgi:alkanesulfonate monooxygenase SsuD/methylene tetrahydromethanopterin reductase-like flavin-dependent oxidoreductase (luciferase family)
VKFGFFYEHQLPRPWEQDSEYRLYQDALEQVALADSLGYDYVWEVEHHFLEEYSHSSAPEVFLAAASQRTKNIRLGHGIVQLPFNFNHTARVVERIGALDLVSGGRVDFGTGESSSEAELGGFLIPRDEKRDQWHEAIDAASRMFVEEPFAGYDGTWFKMPVRNVIPKPLQKPHPPMWVACSRRETIHLAAQTGLGALSFSFIEPSEAKAWVDDYYATLASEECVPAGFAVNPNLAIVTPFMCHDDEETAIERGLDGGHFFGYSLIHHYAIGEHRPGITNIWEEFQEKRSLFGFDRDTAAQSVESLAAMIERGGLGSLRGAIGTPEQIRTLVRGYADAGVDQVIFVSQAGRNRHEHICESMELFAKTVMPEFHDEDEAVRQRRLGPLEEALARALERREPPRPTPSDVVIRATSSI